MFVEIFTADGQWVYVHIVIIGYGFMGREGVSGGTRFIYCFELQVHVFDMSVTCMTGQLGLIVGQYKNEAFTCAGFCLG